MGQFVARRVQRVRSEAFRWWPAWLLVAGGLLALGTRFADRELESYVLDEPQLQDAAARDVAEHHRDVLLVGEPDRAGPGAPRVTRAVDDHAELPVRRGEAGVGIPRKHACRGPCMAGSYVLVNAC